VRPAKKTGRLEGQAQYAAARTRQSSVAEDRTTKPPRGPAPKADGARLVTQSTSAPGAWSPCPIRITGNWQIQFYCLFQLSCSLFSVDAPPARCAGGAKRPYSNGCTKTIFARWFSPINILGGFVRLSTYTRRMSVFTLGSR
jgi:hypothetical protein